MYQAGVMRQQVAVLSSKWHKSKQGREREVFKRQQQLSKLKQINFESEVGILLSPGLVRDKKTKR